MTNRGPLVTLLAVAGLALVLFGVNIASTGSTVSPPAPAGAAATTTATPTATATATVTATAAPEAAYAGRTSGNEATIAIAVKAGRAVAYVCDGRRTEAWLSGTLTDGKLALRGKGGSLSGSVRGNAVFGTVKVGDRSWPYSAQIAKRPAGLYRADAALRGVRNRIGWIVLQDGRQVGIRDQAGAPGPAPQLNPDSGTVSVDGTSVPVQAISGDESFAS